MFDEAQSMIALAETLSSVGWTTVFAPATQRELSNSVLQLTDQMRKRDSESDDFLRGKIAALKWVLTVPQESVKLFEQKQLDLQQGPPDSQPVGHPYAEDNPPEEQ